MASVTYRFSIPKGAYPAGDSHVKVTWVIVGSFKKYPEKLPEFCFVGVVRTIFYHRSCDV